MPALVAALIVALLGGLGTVYASQDASPGDALYGVKTAVEQSGIELPGTGPKNAAHERENGEARDDGVSDEPSGADHGRLASTDIVTGTIGITLTKTISDVASLAGDAQVAGKSENGLDAKLGAANRALERGQPAVAVHQFDAFLHQLNASCRSGHISQADYTKLYGDYSALVTGAGGTAEAKLDSCKSAPGPGANAGSAKDTEPDEDAAAQPGRSGEHRPGSGSAAGNSGDHRQDNGKGQAPASSKHGPR